MHLSKWLFVVAALGCGACSALLGGFEVGPPGAGGDGGPEAGGPPPVDAGGDTPQADSAAACEAGAVMCGSSCPDLTTSPKHCGRCDHDCLGGTCVGRVCQPVSLTTGTLPLLNASRIATDGTSVCWSAAQTAGFVYCVPTTTTGSGATPTPVYMGKRPGPLVVQAGTVFFLHPDPVTSGAVTLRKGMAGTAASSTVVGLWMPNAPVTFIDGYELAINAAATELYAAMLGTRTDATYDLLINSMKADGSSRTSIATINGMDPAALRPHGLAFDGAALYTTYGSFSGGIVWRHALGGGGTTTELAQNEVLPSGAVVDGTVAYWTAGNDPFAIRSSPINAMTPADVVTATSNVGGLVAAGDRVFWTQLNDSAIYFAAAAGGGSPAKYVAGTSGIDLPGPLARDAKAIYWVDKSTGAVKKVALP